MPGPPGHAQDLVPALDAVGSHHPTCLCTPGPRHQRSQHLSLQEAWDVLEQLYWKKPGLGLGCCQVGVAGVPAAPSCPWPGTRQAGLSALESRGRQQLSISACVTGRRDLPAVSDILTRTKLIYVCFSLSGGFCKHW